MPPQNRTPNLGRFGSFGIGMQAALGTAVVPTHFLRYNGGSAVTPTVTRVRDNYANASIETVAERTQGRTLQGKNVTGELEHAGLLLLLQAVTGGTVQNGVMTPNQLNYADNMPLPPVTIEANVPGSPTRITDAQFHNLQLTMNARANFTFTAGFQAITASDMSDPAPAVLPVADVYQFRDHFLKYGATEVAPEASTLTLDVPLQAIDAAQGNNAAAADFIVGFERNGPRVLSGSFTLAGAPQYLRDAYRNGTYATLEWVLRKYGAPVTNAGVTTRPIAKEVKFVIPNAEINMFEPPMTLDRIATPINWTAVSLAGELPFTISVT